MACTAGSRQLILCLVRPKDERMTITHRLYAFVGWAIVALGALHMLATFRLSASTPTFRVWFFGAGLAMAFAGALNLLHRTYGHSAAGVRIVCWAANIFLTCFAIAAGALTGASTAECIVIVGLVGVALMLSFLPSAYPRRGARDDAEV